MKSTLLALFLTFLYLFINKCHTSKKVVLSTSKNKKSFDLYLAIIEIFIFSLFFFSSHLPKVQTTIRSIGPYPDYNIEYLTWYQEYFELSAKVTVIHFESESDTNISTRPIIKCESNSLSKPIRARTSISYLAISTQHKDQIPCGQEVNICSDSKCLLVERQDICENCLEDVVRMSEIGTRFLCDGKDNCQAHIMEIFW